jgi:hypothetical protein
MQVGTTVLVFLIFNKKLVVFVAYVVQLIHLMRTSLLWIQITLLKLISKVQLLAHALDN